MSQRLQIVASAIKQSVSKIVDSSFDYLNLSSYLTPEENQVRLRVRKWVDEQLSHKIIPHVQKATFPQQLISELQKLDITKHFFQKPYGYGSRATLLAVIIGELGREQMGVATVLVAQLCLLGKTIEQLGSEEQKAKYLPQIISLQKLGGWGLTQTLTGSDASHIRTTAVKTDKGYIINGDKRWISNAHKDLLLVWAQNKQTRNIQAFILETKGLKGYKSEVIKNKFAARVVQNCQVTMQDVEVCESQRLSKAVDFQTGTKSILEYSRCFTAWIALGGMMGTYDHAIRYTTKRRQFGRPVAGFQLVQEKLFRMMATTQASLVLALRVCELMERGEANIAQISMMKAHIGEQGKEVVRLGREVCGGNGLLHQNYVMRALLDTEPLSTAEGTYQVLALLVGRDLTGLAAFTRL